MKNLLNSMTLTSMTVAISLVGATPAFAQTVHTAPLPYEVKRAAQSFPVTIYTTASCSPCDAGKALLTGRGVPFIEKTASTDADLNAMKARGLGDTFPALSVGSRSVKKFEAGAWNEALDFGGYPKTGAYPAGYTNPPATPLTSAASTAKPESASTSTSLTPSAPPVDPTKNPAGIRF